jgi:hypothetical protein
LAVPVPSQYSADAIHIPLASQDPGLEGEVVIVPAPSVLKVNQDRISESPVSVGEKEDLGSVLLRGGFSVGEVPGVPSVFREQLVGARVKLVWNSSETRRYSRTNLARTGLVDHSAISSRVTELWLRYLLDHRAELKDGSISSLSFAARRESEVDMLLRSQAWLETYSAIAVYELARNGWQYYLGSLDKGSNALAAWEQSESAVLQPWSGYAYGALLHLVLPRVAPERTIDVRGNRFLLPPKAGWRESLSDCRDFISEPCLWPPFITYPLNLSKVLYYSWSVPDDLFNSAYRSALDHVAPGELADLAKLFHTLVMERAYGRVATLDQRQAELLLSSIRRCGELQIGCVYGAWRLESFGPT